MHRDVTECLEPIRSCWPRHAAQHLTIALVELSQELEISSGLSFGSMVGLPPMSTISRRLSHLLGRLPTLAEGEDHAAAGARILEKSWPEQTPSGIGRRTRPEGRDWCPRLSLTRPGVCSRANSCHSRISAN